MLKPSDCRKVDHHDLPKLPAEWQKYGDFAKICELKEAKDGTANVFIIFVWVTEYFRARFPGRIPVWEKFPLPLIIDDKFHRIGELPEIYPANDITSPDIYYGRWKLGKPTEIRVDVSNPAVDGDYYYPPLRWDPNRGLYMMLGVGVKYGRRR